MISDVKHIIVMYRASMIKIKSMSATHNSSMHKEIFNSIGTFYHIKFVIPHLYIV